MPEALAPTLDTAFRQAERYYKARGPQAPGHVEAPLSSAQPSESELRKRKKLAKKGTPVLPDLNGRGVLDLSRWTTSDEDVDSDILAEGSGSAAHDDVVRAGWSVDQDKFGGRRGAIKCIDLHATSKGRRRRAGWIIGDGLILFPHALSRDDQLQLLQSSLSEYTLPPNPLNLSTHYDLPSEDDISLFERYATDDEALIPTMASRASPLPGDDFAGKEARPLGGAVETRSDSSADPTTLCEDLSLKLQKAVDWKCDEPSARLKAKTARALVEKELRWANLGWIYNWTNKAYDFTTTEPIPFPSGLRETCVDLVRSVPWREVFPDRGQDDEPNRIIPDWESWPDDYAPDTGIVNFYQTRDTLMGHVDRSELDPYRPLVSISLGHAAIFLVGSSTRDTPPIPVVLRSGDALIMAGRARSFYHGVPRIMEGTLPPHFALNERDDETMRACKRYMATARINLNARQVFPTGFQRQIS